MPQRLLSFALATCFAATFSGSVVHAQQQQRPVPRVTPTGQTQANRPSGTNSSTAAPPLGRGGPTSAQSGSKPQRPQGRPLQVSAEQQVDPELEKILVEWEESSGNVKRMTGQFWVYTYNHKFMVEKRGVGRFVYESPDRGRYERFEAKISANDKGREKDQYNKACAPYKLQPDTREIWVCDGKEIIQINDTEKTYDKGPIPPEMQGKNIVHAPLPFVFGMTAHEAKSRYTMELLKADESEVMLLVIPRLKVDASTYQKAYVILDRTNYTPKGVKLIDPTGVQETVHKFATMKVNEKEGFAAMFKGDPFQPNLRNLKPVVRGSDANPNPERRISERPNTTGTRTSDR